MFCHVKPQAFVVFKGFVTQIALIRALTRVGALVYFQIISLSKPFIAFPALIGFLTCVDTHVSFQGAFLHKAFMT